MSLKSRIWLFVVIPVIILFCLIFMLVRFAMLNAKYSEFQIYGQDMAPTLKYGDKVIVDKKAYKTNQPQHGDIIIFHATPQEDFVKRVIGVPGDMIVYKNDTLYLNGKPYKEPYLKRYKLKLQKSQNLTYDFKLQDITGVSKVPKGKVFVLGDNRLKSIDSRHFGFIDDSKIIGKIVKKRPQLFGK